MKKTKTKAAVTPAPAFKAAPAPKAVALKPTTKAAPKAVAKPTPKKKAPAAPAPAKAAAPVPKPVAPAPLVTVITAHIDIGFGNTLYIRGQGPGLSWDRGIPLECADDDAWTVTLPETARPIICKLLVNDLTWSAGSDYVVQPGSTVSLQPTF
jgi:hypothetical protein